VSQNPDDARNNPRNSPPSRRDNPDLPGFGPDFSVPSLMFDEYGEVKPNVPIRPGQPPANRRPNDEPPSIPSLIFDEYGELKPNAPDLRRQAAPALPLAKPAPTPKPRVDETPSVPSLMFDEYGELKPAAMRAFKPVSPPADYRDQSRDQSRGQGPVQRPNQGPAQVAYNQPGPAQPPVTYPPRDRPAISNQAQPPFIAPNPVPARPQEAPLRPGQPEKAAKKSGAWLALWIILAALVVALVGGAVFFLVLNKPATPPANTTPVALGSLVPFRALTPAASTASATASATTQAAGSDLDTLYNQATAQLNNNQFKEAAATLEQLRDRQNQSGNIKHPDVPALLFKAYISLGDQLNKSSQLADFQQSLVNYQKALDTAKTLAGKDRDQQEESALQTRLDTGNLYVKAVTAYNQKELEAAIPLFSQLYARDQNFRDAPGLYYDSLIRVGDGQFAENLLTDAYKSYGRAALLKNVADTRYAQARASSIENQLRQAGKPVPTVPKP
jgi:tetratricopeptide (TPR) repeat protein